MRLMDEEGMDAADVPSAVGYHDEKYFQQIFKKRVGCTVREYQRRRQTEEREKTGEPFPKEKGKSTERIHLPGDSGAGCPI